MIIVTLVRPERRELGARLINIADVSSGIFLYTEHGSECICWPTLFSPARVFSLPFRFIRQELKWFLEHILDPFADFLYFRRADGWIVQGPGDINPDPGHVF